MSLSRDVPHEELLKLQLRESSIELREAMYDYATEWLSNREASELRVQDAKLFDKRDFETLIEFYTDTLNKKFASVHSKDKFSILEGFRVHISDTLKLLKDVTSRYKAEQEQIAKDLIQANTTFLIDSPKHHVALYSLDETHYYHWERPSQVRHSSPPKLRFLNNETQPRAGDKVTDENGVFVAPTPAGM